MRIDKEKISGALCRRVDFGSIGLYPGLLDSESHVQSNFMIMVLNNGGGLCHPRQEDETEFIEM